MFANAAARPCRFRRVDFANRQPPVPPATGTAAAAKRRPGPIAARRMPARSPRPRPFRQISLLARKGQLRRVDSPIGRRRRVPPKIQRPKMPRKTRVGSPAARDRQSGAERLRPRRMQPRRLRPHRESPARTGGSAALAVALRQTAAVDAPAPAVQSPALFNSERGRRLPAGDGALPG